MGKLNDSINASLEWTTTVLFRPFNLKKWIILGFIAMMAGAMTSANFNISNPFPAKSTKSSSFQCPTNIQKGGALHPQTAQEIFFQIKEKVRRHVRLILIIVTLVLLLIVVMSWLMARFHFVFLESIVKNDASIRAPFRKHKRIGESFFNFLAIFSFISMVLTAAAAFFCMNKLLAIGALSHPESLGLKKIIFACLPYAGLIIFWLLIGGVISFVANNFVTIVMYREGCGFIEAWGKARALIKNNLCDMVKFFFLKAVLAIGCAIGFGMIAIVCGLFLMMPVIIIGGLLYALFSLMPQGLQLVFGLILTPLAVSVILVLGYGIMCVFLPFAVFLRTVSLKFMARLNSRYNLFVPLPA